jgi:hypothetical protein
MCLYLQFIFALASSVPTRRARPAWARPKRATHHITAISISHETQAKPADIGILCKTDQKICRAYELLSAAAITDRATGDNAGDHRPGDGVDQREYL